VNSGEHRLTTLKSTKNTIKDNKYS
jgi:serine/threonine protein kinase